MQAALPLLQSHRLRRLLYTAHRPLGGTRWGQLGKDCSLKCLVTEGIASINVEGGLFCLVEKAS